MTILYYIIITAITICLVGITAIIYLVTKRSDPQGIYIHGFSKLWVKVFLGLQFGWKIKVEGLENIDPEQTYVITVNHQSMIDIPLMYAIPLNFKWVAKEEVCRLPVFGWMMKMHGDITIKRGSVNAAKKFINEGSKWIRGGTSIMIFPEGTRSKEGKIRRFKEGAFTLAKSSQVAVLPCVIDGSGDAIINYCKLRRKHSFTIKVLPPVSKEIVNQSSAKELAKLVEKQMIDQHNLMVTNRSKTI